MKKLHDKKLLQLIKIIPPALIITFAFLAILIVLNHNNTQLEKDINSLKKNVISSQKEMIKTQVDQLIQQIILEKNNTEATLKENIQDHIYQAHTIATSIYENNKHKPEAEVTKLIKDALKDIRFNNGRGYFFIYKTSGLSIMHPILPKMEGTSNFDLQDTRGNYIVRDLGSLAKKQDEAFYRWWFIKPDNKSIEFEKIGFGKHFAPYDWFIGTGEYVVDFESDIKDRLIKRLSQIRSGKNGFIFILDYQGNVISHFRKAYQGSNLNNNSDKNIITVGNNLINIAKSGEGYLSYESPLMPSTGKPAKKITYVRSFPQWQWVIGTGFYESETESYLTKHEQVVKEQNQNQLFNLLGISLLVTIFFTISSLLMAKYLAGSFKQYKDRISRDFKELNKVKLQLQHQALHDSLTKLPNRVLLDNQIAEGINLSNSKNRSLAVMFVDLDDFKKINDLHGHSIGDNLLKALGKEFNKVLNINESVARFGGDEFIFCFPDLIDIEEAKQKVREIQSIFKQEFIIKGKSIKSSCSIGVAMYPDDAEKPEDLISKADIVLYKSKSLQKGRYLFFNETINKQVKRDFLIESELRSALKKNELVVFYQPQISVKTGEIFGVEALLRWNNNILGSVSPDEFIPMAEDIGIISEIGTFVIRQALKDIKQFNINHNYDLQLSINISPKQLLELKYAEETIDIIEEAEFNPKQITLEVTENVFISDLNKVAPILQRLNNVGINLSLDDFGTGYSSLSYLGNIPMNEIKIDRSFIDKILVNEQSKSLVKTIIAISRFYNLTVVAEGVENKEQLEKLIEYDCDLIQGYYFDRALSLNELKEKYQFS